MAYGPVEAAWVLRGLAAARLFTLRAMPKVRHEANNMRSNSRASIAETRRQEAACLGEALALAAAERELAPCGRAKPNCSRSSGMNVFVLPEPGSVGLLGLGVVRLGLSRRRRALAMEGQAIERCLIEISSEPSAWPEWWAVLESNQ